YSITWCYFAGGIAIGLQVPAFGCFCSGRSQGIVQVSQRIVDIGEVLIADLQTCNDLASLRIKLTVATERASRAVAYGKQLTGINTIFAVGRQGARRNIRQLLVAHVDAIGIQDRTTII